MILFPCHPLPSLLQALEETNGKEGKDNPPSSIVVIKEDDEEAPLSSIMSRDHHNRCRWANTRKMKIVFLGCCDQKGR